MADQRNGGISWCTKTWNPTRGCSRVSAGCAHCYAEPLTARFSGEGKGMWGRGLAVLDERGPRWTGKVVLVESKLADPLRWRKPQRIFVNSISDLFHESLPVRDIARVFAVMALAQRHTFQVLTKRAINMREILSDPAWFGFVNEEIREILRARGDERWRSEDSFPWAAHPLPNVWLGVSVEHQEAADERIPELLRTPAAVRFLSCEPLLGAVDLRGYLEVTGEDERGHWSAFPLHWVIAGGESGPDARPMHPAWARSLRDQCAAAGVPFHFKQHGAWRPVCDVYPDDDRKLDEIHDIDERRLVALAPDGGLVRATERVQPAPGSWWLERVGKKAAGRELDGRVHNEFPRD